jgi:hypothetical protein
MNSNLAAPAATSVFPSNNMANIIDSLKRLERIGSENSETTKKILEAASELSAKIGSLYPDAYGDYFVITDEMVRSRNHQGDTAEQGASVHHFLRYSLKRPHKNAPLRLYNISEGVFVEDSRMAALDLAEDIAEFGLLGFIEKDLEKRLAENRKHIPTLDEAIAALKKSEDQ